MPNVANRARSFVERHGQDVTFTTTTTTSNPGDDWDTETTTTDTTTTKALVARPNAATARFSPVTSEVDADRIVFLPDTTTASLRDRTETRSPTVLNINGREYELELIAEGNNGLYRLEVNRSE